MAGKAKAGAPKRTLDLARMRVEIAPDVLAREIDGEMVLLHLGSEVYFGLDDIGTRIWSAIAAHGSLQKAQRALLEEFEVAPARLERDLLRLLGELESHGLVAIRDG